VREIHRSAKRFPVLQPLGQGIARELLQGYASHVSNRDHVLLEPRCEAVASDRACSKVAALSYSSWGFHHT
jgi:hypothetical protein